MGLNECQVIERLTELQKQIYGINKIYKTPVTGFSVTITPAIHQLTFGVRGYLLLDPQGNSIMISFRVLPDGTVTIGSTIDLTGDILYLY
jgi:hypothetical protein